MMRSLPNKRWKNRTKYLLRFRIHFRLPALVGIVYCVMCVRRVPLYGFLLKCSLSLAHIEWALRRYVYCLSRVSKVNLFGADFFFGFSFDAEVETHNNDVIRLKLICFSSSWKRYTVHVPYWKRFARKHENLIKILPKLCTQPCNNAGSRTTTQEMLIDALVRWLGFVLLRPKMMHVNFECVCNLSQDSGSFSAALFCSAHHPNYGNTNIARKTTENTICNSQFGLFVNGFRITHMNAHATHTDESNS